MVPDMNDESDSDVDTLGCEVDTIRDRSGSAGKADFKRARNQKRRKRKRAFLQGLVAVEQSATAIAKSETAQEAIRAKTLKKERDALRRNARETHWHQSLSKSGVRMASDVWVVLSVIQGVGAALIDDVRQHIFSMPSDKFQSMGGQSDTFFEQKRRQHQFALQDNQSPVMRLYLLMISHFSLVGYTCRGVFAIIGGAHQFMHQDRGHYHSFSLFVCISRRQLRLGQFGGPDIHI